MRKPGDPTVSTESGEERGFYGRWSRRKQLARAGQTLPEEAAPEGPRPRPGLDNELVEAERDEAQRERACGDSPVLTDEDMPALETLGEDDDYSGFMSPGVSEGLRAKALRKLFMSSKYNVVDGLNDYDDDFTSFEPLGGIVTSDMRHRLELEAEKAMAKEQHRAPTTLAEETSEAALEDGCDHAARNEVPAGEEGAQDLEPPHEAEPPGDAGTPLVQAQAPDGAPDDPGGSSRGG